MTKKEKINRAVNLLQEAGVDFRIGNTSFVNDALSDEQGQKIVSLQSEVDRLRRWEKFSKEVSAGKEKKEKALRKKVRCLSREIDEKDDVISLITEELSRAKVRETELLATVKDYQAELVELKQRYADKVVDEINMNALKSAENALKEKDEVIDDLVKEIKHLYDMVHGDPILKMKERKKERSKEKRGKKPLPTEDNPKEIEMDEAVDRIRKALKEGKTVVVDEDFSADLINKNL